MNIAIPLPQQALPGIKSVVISDACEQAWQLNHRSKINALSDGTFLLPAEL
jgi:hypothetical protein